VDKEKKGSLCDSRLYWLSLIGKPWSLSLKVKEKTINFCSPCTTSNFCRWIFK